MLGNPEVWMRGLWSSATGLSAGGGLSLVVPVPRTFSELETEVVRVVRVVKPTDYSSFLDMTLTTRPFLDIRHATGRLRLQMRQGIDFSVLLRRPGEREDRYALAAFASAYVGVQVIDALTLGLELSELYQLTADVSTPTCAAPCDQNRVQISISPSLRLHLPRLSPSLSVLFPLSTPLRNEVASYVAGRLNVEVLF